MRISYVRSIRKVLKSCSLKQQTSEVHAGTIANNETDSNADTYCLGKNWLIYGYTTRLADVYPYDSSYAPIKNVPIVSGVTAYTDCNGIIYILIIHEALYYGDKLDHIIINPNQICHNQIEHWVNP